MLTNEQKQQNKMEYLSLLTKLNIDLTEFSKYLDNVDFFEKPATAQCFKAYAGGLCEYALSTYYELAQLCNAYCPGKYTQEDVIKVALFKDLYRATLYEAYNKNVKDEETGQWKTVSAYRVKEDRPTFGEIGFSSYMIAKYFVNFTDEQILAICYSRGSEYVADIKDIYKSYRLVTLTKMADSATSYLAEDK